MIVVDCAVLVDVLTAVGGTELLRNRMSVEELHAPALIDYEFVSALRELVRRGHISPHRAADALTDFEDLPVERWLAADEFRRRAFQLRDSMSAYDAAYVTLAEALDCPLITRDIRLSRSTGHGAEILVL